MNERMDTIRRALRPLLDLEPRAVLLHASVIGSIHRKPLSEVGDLDVYLVIERTSRQAFDAVREAGDESARALARRTGGDWVVEMRRGPLQPEPRSGPRQLHLLLDDRSTLGHAPGVRTLLYRLGGHPLGGQGLESLRNLQPATLVPRAVAECRAELERALAHLAALVLVWREWRLGPRPRLEERSRAVVSAWDHRCLLKQAVAAGDGWFPATLGLLGRSASLPTVAGRIRDALAEWPHLPARWTAVSARVTAALEHRLRLLQEEDTARRNIPSPAGPDPRKQVRPCPGCGRDARGTRPPCAANPRGP